MPVTTACWDYLNCNKKDQCPAYPKYGTHCWDIAHTLCNNQKQGNYHEKIGSCRSDCSYYHACMAGNF
jgi:hypothetical protein